MFVDALEGTIENDCQPSSIGIEQISLFVLKRINQFIIIMTPMNFKSLLCASLLIVVLHAHVNAQVDYMIAPESTIQVDGTSNQTPEWSVYATQIDGSVTVNDEGSVDSAVLVIPSKMMKSRKSPIMDRGMYGALKADDYPEIMYELLSVSDVAMMNDSTFSLNTTGNLTIAAETKEIMVPVEGIRSENEKMHFTGQHAILMSDYGLKPPSLMFGAYRTGDELVISFELIAVPSQ